MNKHMEAPGYRPVLRGNPIFFPDVQGRLPVGWCQDCGSEVFEPNRLLCRRCVRREKYEKLERKPMYPLLSGTGWEQMRQ